MREDELRRLAKLSRLSMEDARRLSGGIERLQALMAGLSAVPTEGMQPLELVECLALREDEVRESLPRELLLAPAAICQQEAFEAPPTLGGNGREEARP